MDFSDLKLDINIKSCCLYEQMTGNNFFHCNTEEDALHLIYCCLVTNNDIDLTYNVFLTMLKNKKFDKVIGEKYLAITKFNEQFNKSKGDTETTGTTEIKITITEMATALIVKFGVDAKYVMYDMGLWEIMAFYAAADEKKKEELMEHRLWAYIGVAPHVDTKKIKGPDDLISFEWEKNSKKERAEKDLKDKDALIKRILGGNKNG